MKHRSNNDASDRRSNELKYVIPTALAAALMVSAALPGIALAQSSTLQSEIVVTAKHQKLWDKGLKLEEKGMASLVKAERDLNVASNDVSNGQSKRDAAETKVANASAEFRQLTSNVPQSGDPKEAAKWADRVANAADSWAKNDNREEDGQSNLTKAMKQQAKAQEAIGKAQSDIAKGRTMKAEAQQRSMVNN